MGARISQRGIASAVVLCVVASLILLLRPAAPVEAGPKALPAGGKAVAHRAGGKKVAYKGARPVPKLFDTGHPGGEPTLGITKQGEIFFPSIDLFSTPPNQVEVLRSSDRGQTWQVTSPRVGPAKGHAASLDPYVFVDPASNRVFNIDLTVACSILSFSDDRGKSWTTNPLACGRPVNDHQTLFAGPPAVSPTVGYPSIVYYCWNDVASSSCSKSLDGGVTFHPTGSPSFTGVQPSAGGDSGNPAPFCGGLHGHGVVDTKGVVYIPKESCLQPWLAISKDEGKTWRNVKVSPLSAGDGILDPSVDVDAKGNIYFTWVGGDRHIYLAVSKDGGDTWTKAMDIRSPGVRETDLPSIDVSKPGHVAISYLGSENSPWKPNCQNCGNDQYAKTTWNGYVTVTKNALAKKPLFLSTTVNSKADPFFRRRCGPGRCQYAFDFVDVVIAPNGTVYTPWVDGCYGPCIKSETVPSNGNAGVVARLDGFRL